MHEKEFQTQLSQKLTQAAQQVTVGARYMYYKQLSYKVAALTTTYCNEGRHPDGRVNKK